MAEYDAIGAQYSEARRAPWRLHLEACTITRLAGDGRGARVLDLACGDGFYTRRLKALALRKNIRQRVLGAHDFAPLKAAASIKLDLEPVVAVADRVHALQDLDVVACGDARQFRRLDRRPLAGNAAERASPHRQELVGRARSQRHAAVGLRNRPHARPAGILDLALGEPLAPSGSARSARGSRRR